MEQVTFKNIDHMLTRDMVEEYNRLTAKNITKFSSREAGVKQLTKAREAFLANKPVEEDKKEEAFNEIACPKCGETHDQTYAGKEGTAAGDRLFCHHCNTEYYPNGKIYKQQKDSTTRGAAIAESWNNPEVASKRKQRTHVTVNGASYNSVADAFTKLGLPMGQHIKFRMELKAEGKKDFKLGDKVYHFETATK